MIYHLYISWKEANSNLLFQYYIKRNETQSHEYQMIFTHHSMVSDTK